MKTSEAFKQAKGLLWDGKWEQPWGKHRYICVALNNISSFEKGQRCQVIINKLLDPTGKHEPDTLEDWLIKQGHIGQEFYMQKSITDYPDIMRKVQVTRHAWLNHLIKYYRSIGD